MPRINVNEDWFSDATKRRAALVRALSHRPRNIEREADGIALDAWRLAQRYWKDSEQLIPEAVWQRADLELLIECDLAERRPEGVYVRGTREQHEWLRQRVEAGRSRAKGERNDKGRFVQRPTDAPAAAGVSLAKSPATAQREPSGSPAAHQPPALAPALALKKISKPPTRSARGVPPSAFDLEIACSWIEHGLSVLPTLRTDKLKAAHAIRQLREIDKLPEGTIRELLAFVASDDFWRDKALSPQTLRSRSKNGLTKLENLMTAMQSKKAKAAPASEKDTTPWL